MHRLKGLQAILCDWSGVISDDRRPVYETGSRMMEHFGLERMTYETWLMEGIRASPRELFLERGVSLDGDAIFALYAEMYPHVVETGLRPVMYPDAILFFKKASLSRNVIVISAHPQKSLNAEVLAYKLNGEVSAFIGSVKDKSETIREVLLSLGMKLEDAAYVGDMTHDIHAARKAGVIAIAVSTGYHSREKLEAEKPDILVDSLTELAAHL
ncbi:MAG: HAD hydrolase-like protein [Patescibacteria group bacterium]